MQGWTKVRRNLLFMVRLRTGRIVSTLSRWNSFASGFRAINKLVANAQGNKTAVFHHRIGAAPAMNHAPVLVADERGGAAVMVGEMGVPALLGILHRHLAPAEEGGEYRNDPDAYADSLQKYEK